VEKYYKKGLVRGVGGGGKKKNRGRRGVDEQTAWKGDPSNHCKQRESDASAATSMFKYKKAQSRTRISDPKPNGGIPIMGPYLRVGVGGGGGGKGARTMNDEWRRLKNIFQYERLAWRGHQSIGSKRVSQNSGFL